MERNIESQSVRLVSHKTWLMKQNSVDHHHTRRGWRNNNHHHTRRGWWNRTEL